MNRIHVLDGIRGFGVIFIVLAHIIHRELEKGNLPDFWYVFASSGLNLVNLFFVGSGFMVYRSLMNLKGRSTSYRRNFYIRRFFRIIPLWWTLLFYLYFIKAEIPLKVLLANMVFFFGDLSLDSPYLSVGPAWTLLSEEAFYIFLPFTWPLVKKENILRPLVFFIFVAALMLKLIPVFLGPDIDMNIIYRNPLFQVRYFILGIFLNHLYSDKKYRQIIESFFKRLGPYLTALIYCILVFRLNKLMGLPIPSEITLSFLMLAPLAGSPLVTSFMNRKILRYAGIRCYGIYLLQMEAQYFAEWLWPHTPFSPEITVFVKFVLVLLFLIPLSHLSFKYFEFPLTRYARRITSEA